ncbi:MAG: hypothetical protein ISN26_02240 [Betaproteobacteria bacterium AqS2]|uniref:Uncharacterized protein n=1 Tax=Candidatus Amphirhobacter heronislandensis TaxID=1732024 RepID=A0A930UFU4_9GAMM|nr:hypothetical protein [Betaproteobacteria bacterium AqS2]
MTAKIARKATSAAKHIEWPSQYRAMTDIHTARILKEKEKDGKEAYSIIITTFDSRIRRISKARTLAEAIAKVKKKLG